VTDPTPETLLRLRIAVEASGEVVFMTDRSGVITYVNPEFERLYGYSADDVVGIHTPRILKGGATAPDEYASFWQHLVNHRVVRREFANRTKAGETVYVESSANPIVSDEGCIGFLAVQRDVTDRKQLEQRFLQAQKMEAIGRLAGGIAHDFNNLLTAILGYSDLILERVRGNALLTDDVEEIKKAGESASRLTRQLLAFSRQQILQPQVIDVNAVIGGVQRILDRVIGEDVRLVVDMDPRLALVTADPGQIEQLVLNLAVNARDAMPQGGRLSITTANATVDAAMARRYDGARASSYVALTVADTGCGMSADTLAHAFEPFFTTKPPGKGTGLGLATVFGVVRQSGGFVTVDSAPGVGTSVTAYVPAASVTLEPLAPPVEMVDTGGTETILLVEDEVAVRQLMERTLARRGYCVIAPESASAAVRVAESSERHIDLLLSDVVMPEMSGPELAQRIVPLRPDIRVLYVSGFPNGVRFERGLISPNVAFLPKPFAPQVLARKVRECLAGRVA
jgi:PAS domain S-box-containing protein